MNEIIVHTEMISLDQFLKWSQIADTGGQAKQYIRMGLVSINGITVFEVRKKIYNADVVEVINIGKYIVVYKENEKNDYS